MASPTHRYQCTLSATSLYLLCIYFCPFLLSQTEDGAISVLDFRIPLQGPGRGSCGSPERSRYSLSSAFLFCQVSVPNPLFQSTSSNSCLPGCLARSSSYHPRPRHSPGAPLLLQAPDPTCCPSLALCAALSLLCAPPLTLQLLQVHLCTDSSLNNGGARGWRRRPNVALCSVRSPGLRSSFLTAPLLLLQLLACDSRRPGY